jgi:hypothetical protein
MMRLWGRGRRLTIRRRIVWMDRILKGVGMSLSVVSLRWDIRLAIFGPGGLHFLPKKGHATPTF